MSIHDVAAVLVEQARAEAERETTPAPLPPCTKDMCDEMHEMMLLDI